MKLIIAGASGFVGTELLKQSLRRSDITSVVALSRKPLPGAPKLKKVVIKDYDDFPEDVKAVLAGADACIWTVAITPTKSMAYDFAEVTRVCQTSTLVGMQAMHDAGPISGGKPFRFLYVSGFGAERDQTKSPAFKPEYSLMRGATEVELLSLARTLGIEACVAKPGLIRAPGLPVQTVFNPTMGVYIPSISVVHIAAAMLDQVVSPNGFDNEPLVNEDLAEMGARSASLDQNHDEVAL